MDEGPRAVRAEGLDPLDVVAALDGEAVLVDVRSREQRARGGHIQGDVSVPDDALEQVTGHDRRIVLYCQTGERACAAAHRLASQGFTRVAYLQGGLAAWESSGLEMGLPSRVDLDQSMEDAS